MPQTPLPHYLPRVPLPHGPSGFLSKLKTHLVKNPDSSNRPPSCYWHKNSRLDSASIDYLETGLGLPLDRSVMLRHSIIQPASKLRIDKQDFMTFFTNQVGVGLKIVSNHNQYTCSRHSLRLLTDDL